jgi:hypothetical protein
VLRCVSVVGVTSARVSAVVAEATTQRAVEEVGAGARSGSKKAQRYVYPGPPLTSTARAVFGAR